MDFRNGIENQARARVDAENCAAILSDHRGTALSWHPFSRNILSPSRNDSYTWNISHALRSPVWSLRPCKIFKLRKGCCCPARVTYLLTHQFARAIVRPSCFPSFFPPTFQRTPNVRNFFANERRNPSHQKNSSKYESLPEKEYLRCRSTSFLFILHVSYTCGILQSRYISGTLVHADVSLTRVLVAKRSAGL